MTPVDDCESWSTGVLPVCTEGSVVQFQKLRSSELGRTCSNGLSQLGDEERILTTSSLKSTLFNNYEV